MIDNSIKDGLEIQKALIGEFVIFFEDINDWIRFLIPKIIFKGKIDKTQIKNIDCLTEQLTLEPLKSKFDALIADNFKDLKKLIEINKKLSIKISSFTTIRNSIVHGSYRLGWENFQGILTNNSFSLRHSKSTKKGFEKRAMIVSIDKLKELNLELKKISFCLNLIAAILDTHFGYKLEKQTEIYLNLLDNEVNNIKNSKLEYLDIENN